MRKVRLICEKHGALNGNIGDIVEIYSRNEALEFYNLCQEDKDWLTSGLWISGGALIKHKNYTKTHGEFMNIRSWEYEEIGGQNEENEIVGNTVSSFIADSLWDGNLATVASGREYESAVSINERARYDAYSARGAIISHEYITIEPPRLSTVTFDSEAFERLRAVLPRGLNIGEDS